MSRQGEGGGDKVDICAQERVPSTPGWGALVELWAQALEWKSDRHIEILSP